jgi:prepilin-type N-terminal cleavage/methylation domain-containing protein
MTRPRHNSAGFTLAELVVAIAILGVGMTMAAALFPAAMKQLEYSMRDITGTVICQRGLDVARTVLDPNGSNIPVLAAGSNLDDPNNWLISDPNSDPNNPNQRFGSPSDPNCLLYYDPDHAGRKNKGFLVLARRVSANPSDGYLILVSAYWKKVSSGTVSVVPLTGGNFVDANSTTVNDTGGHLRTGSPFIDPNTGQFAVITAVNAGGTQGTLDRPMTRTCTTGFVVWQSNVQQDSPVIGTMQRTVQLK